MSAGVVLAALCGLVAALAVVEVAGAAAPGWRHVLARRRRAARLADGARGAARDDRARGALRDDGARDAAARRRGDAAATLLTRHGIRTPHGLSGRLAAAGISHAGAAEQAMALKCALALGTALVVLPVATRASPGGALVLLSALPAAGFLAPDVIVARRARRRARLLRAQAPELLQRVRLGAEAGLSPLRVLALATERDAGLLASELRALLVAVELGMTTEDALRSLCARCPVPEVQALAAALRRSARHGAPLAQAAGALAAGSLADRARRVHERAQGAAPKIQLVVALLLVPAALMLIAATLVAGMR